MSEHTTERLTLRKLAQSADTNGGKHEYREN